MHHSLWKIFGLFALAAGCLLVSKAAFAAIEAKDVPLFHLTAYVISVKGDPPDGKQFTFTLGSSSSTVKADAWTPQLAFTAADAEAALKNYPNLYIGGFPVVTTLTISGVEDTTVIEGRISIDETGEQVSFAAKMAGGSLGLLTWRGDDKKPHVLTMADYNQQRYWDAIKSVDIPADQRPKFFPIADRFICGDADRRDMETGINMLAHAGFNTLMLPPDKTYLDILNKAGLTHTAWAIYNPPGYAFDFTSEGGKTITPAEITKWGQDLAKPYLDAGFKPEDMAIYVMSDEPGWYYPSMFDSLKKNADAMARFHKYLGDQGVKPADVGAKSWDEVLPLGRSKAIDLPSRKLFYWTMRFFSWDSSRHFAASSESLQKAFYKNMPTPTNFNFFSGRLYVPGPVANNGAKTDPDAAMGGHDWLEFGRMAGGVRMGTEDWFGDGQAYQWSFYCAKMRSATAKSGGEYGGYVIPRTAGAREDGIQQKILSIIGSGGKWLEYFVFGPEYVFPGNCYSENVTVLPKMAETHKMIGQAEDVLWPGRRPQTPVAILHPRSAEMWDAKKVPIPNMISDATNTGLNYATVDYMAEVFDLYLALQHANIPVDFVDEDDLNAKALKPYQVLYVTEPNIPVEGQKGLLDWTKKGGTLVMVSNAGSADRYDDPSNVLAKGIGIAEQPRERLLIGKPNDLKESGAGSGLFGDFTTYGPRGTLTAMPKNGALVSFTDGTPALVENKVGSGVVVYFPWMPGLSYYQSQNGEKDKLPVGFSEAIRKMIIYPVGRAKIMPPVLVDRPMIETPLLLSEKGGAVTLLNWSGEAQQDVKLTINVPFTAASVESMKQGKLNFTQTKQGVTCTLPLAGADIVVVKP